MKFLSSILAWIDERTGLVRPIMQMLVHPVPPGARWYYVLGTAVLTAFVVQLATGVALATIYVPSAGEAYESLKYISAQAPFGALVRGMHYWGASAMVFFAVAHMIQVYLFGAYKYPREANWLSGVALLFIVLAMGFTGQVLRWDQTAIWTVAVGAEQALRMPWLGKFLVDFFISGPNIGGATFSHFFALHVFILPGLVIGGIGFHLWLVLHNGISEPPVVGEPVDPKTYKQKYHEMLQRIGRPFWPDAAWRDIVFSTFVVIAIAALAARIGAPELGKPPDPSIIQAEPKPDWYLLWYFALLALTPHAAEDYLIILFPVFLIGALVAVPFLNNKGERHVKRRPWATGIVIVSLTCIGALWRLGVTEPWTPKFDAKPLTEKIIGTTDGAVAQGANLFDNKGCLYCHAISGHGGQRGPDLTDVGDRLDHDQIVIRIMNGGYNMPSYANTITPQELASLTAFLQSRKTH